ncbi:MAG: hypothetical protein WCY11_04475 [Novosphingobium sp.]
MRLADLISRSHPGHLAAVIAHLRDESPAPRGLLRANLELLAIFAVLLAVDRLFFGASAFASLTPNPYWLAVLAMAVGYGSGMGLLAAIVATTLWVAASRGDTGADHLQAMLQLSIQPMLWVATALVVGELTTSRLNQVRRLQRRIARTDEEFAVLMETVEHLVRTNRSLQVRIATEERTVGQAISLAIELANEDEQRRLEGITLLVALAAQTEDFVFYVAQGHRFVARLRGAEAADHAEVLSWDELNVLMTASRGPRSSAPARSEASPALTSVPIFSDDEALMGMLMINLPDNELPTAAKIAELTDVARSLCQFSQMPAITVRPVGEQQPMLREGAA